MLSNPQFYTDYSRLMESVSCIGRQILYRATWEAYSMHAWFKCEDKLKPFLR